MIDDMFSYLLFDNLVQTGITGAITGQILFISEFFNVFVGPLASIIMVVIPFSFNYDAHVLKLCIFWCIRR